MNLQELKERVYAENFTIAKEYFIEEDEEFGYVIIPSEKENVEDDEITIIYTEELLKSIHSKNLKLEYVEEDFCLGLLDGKSIRIEHL